MKKGWLMAIGAVVGVAAVAGTVAAVVAKKKGYDLKNLKGLCKTTKEDECECGCCDCCCEVDDLPDVPETDEDISVEGAEEASEDVATTETPKDVVDTTVENEKQETETVSE